MSVGSDHRRRYFLLSVPAIGALILSGCIAEIVGGAIPPRAEAEVYGAVDCRSEPGGLVPDTETPNPERAVPVPGTVPAELHAIAAIRCTLEFVPVDGPASDVEWRVERLEGDLGALIAALAEPDDAPPPGELLCTADMEIIPALWLEDRAGGFTPVHYPRDACGKTKPAVRDALDALQVTTVERVGWDSFESGGREPLVFRLRRNTQVRLQHQ